MTKVYVHGLNSCGMRNTVVQSYRDFLIANGHEVVDDLADSDMALLWTCGFRRDVRDNSLAEIQRYLREYHGELVVAGCLPDIDRELLNSQFQGRVIPWRNDSEKLEKLFGAPKKKLSEIPLVLFKKQLYEDEATYRKEHPGADIPYVGRYSQLYISEGCVWECAYCSERLAFPAYRSFSEDDIVETCRREVEQSGKRAVVLLGDSVGDYGIDTGSSLPRLIRRLRDMVPGIKLALQDFNPYHFIKFYDDMVEFLRSSLVVHLQIPYQSASDHILRLMKRPYKRSDLDKVFGTINELGFTEFDSHMIVGFPGETEEDFEESVAFAIRHRPKYMLVNGFMESPQMPAAKLPRKVDAETKHYRIREAETRLKVIGIICNADDSEYARKRFYRMNQPASTEEGGLTMSSSLEFAREKDQRQYDGRASYQADDEIEAMLDAHFERFNIDRREICRNFTIYARRVFLKRFLAHYEFFRMTIDLPGDIVELGVYRGVSLMSWANFLETRNMGDRAKQVIGFDNWKGFVSFDPKDGKEDVRVNKVIGGYDASVFKEILADAIAVFDKDRFIPQKPRIILVEGQIEESVPRFVEEHPGLRICLLHVDCDLYRPTKTALEVLWPRVVNGGVVIFDDYGIRPWEGESTAVDEYFADKGVVLRRLDWAMSPSAYIIKGYVCAK